MVSWVNSNYATFGSGITVPGYGFILHNRGGLFTLNPSSPNVIAPHKRPYNTLSAGFVMQGGTTTGHLMTLLLMGGDMQAQGHAQMMVNMVDLGANLQASTDMARFYHNQVPNTLDLESQLYNLVGPQLGAMGHHVVSTNGGPMGGYQAVLFTPDLQLRPPKDNNEDRPIDGFYRAGTDHRKDGEAVRRSAGNTNADQLQTRGRAVSSPTASWATRRFECRLLCFAIARQFAYAESLRISSLSPIAVTPLDSGQVPSPPWTRKDSFTFKTSRARWKPRDNVGADDRLISIAISGFPPRSKSKSTSAPSSVL